MIPQSLYWYNIIHFVSSMHGFAIKSSILCTTMEFRDFIENTLTEKSI